MCAWLSVRFCLIASVSAAGVPSLPLPKVEELSFLANEDHMKPPAKTDSGVHMESASSNVAGMPAVCAVFVPELAHC